MKNNKKTLNSLILMALGLYIYPSLLWAECTIQQVVLDVNARTTPLSATICGQQVAWTSAVDEEELSTVISTILTPGDIILPGPPGTYQISVNGINYFSGIIVTQSEKDAFLQALGFTIVQPVLSATSMASTSASSRVGDTVYSRIINPIIETRSQKQQQIKQIQKVSVFLADLKYERAEFTQTNDSGNIGGFTAGGSYDINRNFTVGAIIPYDYLSFDTFNAHRTGIILYGKNNLKLPSNFELNTAINGNYLYTDAQFEFASDQQLHTYGGGFSTRLKYDNDSDFVPTATFSLQYNQDNTNIQDNHQYLIKLGPSLGYRILDNALIQVSGVWNKDVTHYQINQNDTDFYDLGIEGGWFISGDWQLRGGYKKVLGLSGYESDSVYLGSSIQF